MAEGFQIGSAFIDVHADVDGVQKEVSSKLGGGGGGFFKGVGLAAGAAIAGGAVLAVGSGIKKILGTGFGEFLDADALNKQLEAGLKSTGNAAGVTVDHMNDLASSIQGYSGQTDDSIAQTESLLLTFTNISNNNPQKIFDKTTVAAADMAATMGGDASKYAVQLGKALNDPIKGTTALTRVGVTFTDQQKAQIAAMQKSGDTAGAQAIILGELNKEFGGRAAAAGQSFSGTLQRIQRGFEDVAQAVTGAFMPLILPALNAVANGLQKLAPIAGEVSQKIVKGIKGIDLSGIKNMFKGFGGSFGDIVKPIGTLVTTMSPLSILFKALAPVLPPIASALGQVGKALGGALATILPSIVKLFGTLVGVLSGVLAQILPVIAKLLLAVVKAITPLLPVVGQLAGVLGDALGQVIKALAPVIVTLVKAVADLVVALLPLIPPLASIIEAVIPLIPVLVDLVLTAVTPFLKIVVALLPVVAALVTILVSLLVPAIKFVADILKIVVDAITAFIDFLTGDASTGTSDFANDFKDIWKGIGDFIGGVIKGIQTVFKAIFDWIGAYIQGVFEFYKGIFTVAWNYIKDTVTNAVNTVKDIIKAVFDAIKGYIKAVTDIWGAIFQAAWDTIKTVVDTAIRAVKTIIQGIMDSIKAIIEGRWDDVPGIMSKALGKAGGIVSDGFNKIVGFARDLGGKIAKAVGDFGNTLFQAGKDLVSGLVNGFKGAINNAVGVIKGLINLIPQGVRDMLGIHSPSTVMAEIGMWTGKGFIQGLLGTKNEIDSSVASAMGGLTDKVTKYFDDLPGKLTKSQAAIKGTIIGVIGDVTKALDKEADKRTAYLKSLDDETSKLNSAKDARNNYRDAVASSSIALGDVTKVKSDADNPVTAAGIIANLQTANASVSQFKSIYDQLKTMGLGEATLGQITAGFQQNGDLSYAQAILNGGQAAIAQINALQNSLKTAANALGSDTAHTMFDAGVNVAQGLVNGVKSQISAVEQTMEDMAKSITKKVKKALKIKSPSRVMANEVGQYIPLGIVRGIESKQGVLNAAVGGMVSTPVASSGVGSIGSTGSARGGDVYVSGITIDASNVDDFNRVISIFSGIGQAARQGRGRTSYV